MGVSKKHIGIISMEDKVALKFVKNVGIVHHFSNGILPQPFMTELTEENWSVAQSSTLVPSDEACLTQLAASKRGVGHSH